MAKIPEVAKPATEKPLSPRPPYSRTIDWWDGALVVSEFHQLTREERRRLPKALREGAIDLMSPTDEFDGVVDHYMFITSDHILVEVTEFLYPEDESDDDEIVLEPRGACSPVSTNAPPLVSGVSPLASDKPMENENAFC
jgi:hypothetical protein